jgi:isopentenyldiphosphate isomerase
MSEPEEIFELVDEEGQVIGTAPRSECHRRPDLIHRSVHVFVVNGRGEIYLQLRSRSKDIQPGRWDTSVGGHLAPGEGYREAAAREMDEELALAGSLRFLHRYLWRTDRESELVETYFHVTDELPAPDPGEIEEGRFFSPSQLESLLEGDDVTPNLREELRRLREAGEF